MKMAQDVAFVISLDTDIGLYRKAVSELMKLGYNPQNIIRVSAVVINGGKTKEDRLRGSTDSRSVCIKLAKKLKLKRCLICEDDIVVDEKWLHLWPSMQDEIKKIDPEQWDLLYLGYRRKYKRSIEGLEIVGFQYLERLPKPYCTHCYYVNSSFYSTVLEHRLQWREAGTPIDVAHCNLIAKGRCRAIGVYPRLVSQADRYSAVFDKQVSYTKMLTDRKTRYLKDF